MQKWSRKLSLLVIVTCFVTAAIAISIHFIYATATINPNTGVLTVAFKEAGLGGNQLINYELNGTATAIYHCINGGGNHPTATSKSSVTLPVTGSGSFSSGRNGSITAALVLDAPDANLTCSGGQRLVLGCVSFSNVTLIDTTNSVLAPGIPGTFKATMVVPRNDNSCAVF